MMNPIIEKGNGWSLESRVGRFGGARFLKIENGISDEISRKIQDLNIQYLVVRNADFLKYVDENIINEVKHIFLEDCKFLEYLEKFRSLKYLSVSGEIRDLSFLRNIDNIEGFAANGVVNSCKLKSSLKLKYLALHDYIEKDLSFISSFECLECLSVRGSSLTSLDGINKLQNLKSLIISETSISEIYIPEIVKEIKEIRVLYAPNLEIIEVEENEIQYVDLRDLKKINNLESFLNSSRLIKVILENVGKIRNIKYLCKMKDLELFSYIGPDRILDGDLSPLLKCRNLQYVNFGNRKNYSHTRKSIEDAMGLESLERHEIVKLHLFPSDYYENML